MNFIIDPKMFGAKKIIFSKKLAWPFTEKQDMHGMLQIWPNGELYTVHNPSYRRITFRSIHFAFRTNIYTHDTVFMCHCGTTECATADSTVLVL